MDRISFGRQTEASVTIQTHVTTGRPHPGTGLAESIIGCHSGTLVCSPSRGSRSCGARTFQLLFETLTKVPVQACTKTLVFVFCAGCTKDRVEAAWRDRFTASVVNRPMQRTSPVLDPALPESACNIPESFLPPEWVPFPRLHSLVARNK